MPIQPNPASKEVDKITMLHRQTEQRLRKLINKHVTNVPKNYNPLRRSVQREIRELLLLVDKETKPATRKAYFTGWIAPQKRLEKVGVKVVQLNRKRQQKLIFESQRQFIDDYKIVNKELAERLDKIIVKGLVEGRPGNIRTGRLIKPIKLTQGNLRNDLILEILEDNIKLIDSAGRLWTPNRYAQMVARTRTREYTTSATETLSRNNRIETYKVSTHAGGKDDAICAVHDGRIFRYSWATSAAALKFPVADRLPPYHPNCIHVITPFIISLRAVELAKLAA